MSTVLAVFCFRLKNKAPPKVPARDYPGIVYLFIDVDGF